MQYPFVAIYTQKTRENEDTCGIVPSNSADVVKLAYEMAMQSGQRAVIGLYEGKTFWAWK